MKYVVATLVSIAVLFLFAVFAVAVGWRHGGGSIVQLAIWSIVAVLWGTIIKKWNTIISRLHRTATGNSNTHILDDNVKFTILAGLIIIIGAGLFFAIRTAPKPRGITASEYVARYKAKYPEYYQWKDSDVLYSILTHHPYILIYNSRGSKWIGDDDWRTQ